MSTNGALDSMSHWALPGQQGYSDIKTTVLEKILIFWGHRLLKVHIHENLQFQRYFAISSNFEEFRVA